jgi:YYY domain-containing protein
VGRRFQAWVAAGWAGGWIWLVLAVAFILRVGGITHGVSFHPDERHIISVAEKMIREGDLNPHFFAYGSFPFYILCALAVLLRPAWEGATSYDGLFTVGRSIAVGCGLVTVWLTFVLGRLLTGSRRIGLLGAALLALNVFHVQLSRFFTVDILLTALFTATLVVLCRLASAGRWRDYAVSGVFMGLALATKISALSLFAPFGIAVIAHRYTASRWWDRTVPLKVGTTILVAGLFLFIAAPYSFLDWETFIRHNHEQISMTRGLWRPPYTVQYLGTVPFLYPLEQMYRYTLGEPLAFFAGLGFIGVVLGLRRLDRHALVVLAGVVPVFLSIGGLDVKFPRYLLTMYPVLMIWAASAAVMVGDSLGSNLRHGGWAARARAVPAALLVGWCVFYVTAFVGIYRVSHAYETASEWIFERVPHSSRILGVHWDDKLPISLPGLSPHQFRYRYEGRDHELEVYERDNPAKIARMAEQLAQHDYLVFPTARTYGSIPRRPEEYPDTIRMLSALFRGELGYVLEQSFKVRPELFGITFDDDLADESFTVYDHPKVLIFRNIERLSAEEIVLRIARAGSGEPLVSREQMVQRDAVAPISGTHSPSSWLALFLWFAVLQVCALAVAPFLAALFDCAPDRGYGLSKALGVLVVGYLAWGATWYVGAPTNSLVGWLILGGLVVVAHLFVRRRWGGWRGFFLVLRPHALTVELLFGGAFLLCAAFRALAPEIFWGEKPMDFTFFNYFVRLETLPPADPWVAGRPMGYYYLGVYLVAFINKLTAVDTGIGYNLALAGIGAWLVAAIYSVAVWFIRNRWGSAVAAIAIVGMANFEVAHLAFFTDRAWNFDLFWASSRVLTSPAITEYPLWALLFADLHAHVIALPFVAVLGGLILYALGRPTDPTGRRGYQESVLHGFVLGALFALNTWDCISGAALTGVFLAYRLATADRGAGWWRGAFVVLSDGLVIALAAAFVVAPFAATAVSTDQIWWGWVRGEFSTLPQVAAHLGQWWVLIVVGVLSLGNWAKLTAGRYIGAVFFGALPLVAGALSALAGTAHVPWLVLGSCAFFGTACALVVARRNERTEIRAAALLVWVGLLVAAGAETLYLMDRMNTIFKFYHFIWFALGVGGVALAARGWERSAARGWVCRAFAGVTALSACGIAAVGSCIIIGIMTTFQRVPGPRPTLNGGAYLRGVNQFDAPLVEWLRANVSGTPVILEAHGDPYREFTRIAMHTGLPTVLGWRHHVRQRGASEDEVERRSRDIETIYSTTDAEEAFRLITSYNVSYIIVSVVERGRYPRTGLLKFENRPDLFPVLKKLRGAAIYGVARR